MKTQIIPALLPGLSGVLLAVLTMSPLGLSQDQPMLGMPSPATKTPPQEQATTQSGLTLVELEQIALSNNPTLAQAAAEIRAATGRKLQSGLYPNPTVGYQGEQIRGGTQGGGEQGFFVSQDIVLGGELGLSRRALRSDNNEAGSRSAQQSLS